VIKSVITSKQSGSSKEAAQDEKKVAEAKVDWTFENFEAKKSSQRPLFLFD
jgi:hypothetical protein